jgi:hypothetical protein
VVNETLHCAEHIIRRLDGRSFGPWYLLISCVDPRDFERYAAALDIHFLHTLSFIVLYSVTHFNHTFQHEDRSSSFRDHRAGQRPRHMATTLEEWRGS